MVAFCGVLVLAKEAPDWLVDPSPYRARITSRDNGRELVLENGLIRRVLFLGSNAATVEFSSVTTGESWLRAVKPEATVEIDGKRFTVGSLHGQPNTAFLQMAWLRSRPPGALPRPVRRALLTHPKR